MTQYTKISPTKDTIVFAGDRRLSHKTGYTDTNVKATPLGTYAIGGALGYTRNLHPKTKEVERDMHLLLQEFFANREVNGTTVGELSALLKSKHDEYIMQHKQGTHINYDGRYFSIVISALQDGRVIEYDLKCPLRREKGLVPEKPGCFVCRTGALIINGEEDIVNSLLSLTHPAFTELYERPEILRLLSDPRNVPFETVTIDQAIEICRTVNLVCSEQMQEVTGKTSTISSECDVYVVDRDGIHQA